MLACEHEGKRRGGGGTFLSYIYNVLYKLHVRKYVSFDKLPLTFSYQCDKGVTATCRHEGGNNAMNCGWVKLRGCYMYVYV